MLVTEPPSLAREIGKVAWFVAKILVVAAAVIGLFAWIFQHNVTAGILTLYVLIFAGMIAFLGWQNYKWKKRDWEDAQRERERQQRDAHTS
jgi:protein-S-isoprenylcysteine O-methyltransferase Ste14